MGFKISTYHLNIMAKIKIKANMQPYANNESLQKTLSIEIKKAFNDVFLNDLISKIIDVFNKFDSKKTLQLESYQAQIVDLRDLLEKSNQDTVVLQRIILILVVLVLSLIIIIIYLIYEISN